MATYETEYSNFPQQKITLHKFKNVDDSVGAIFNQIHTLQAQGLFNQAQRVIQNNIDVLGRYNIDATTINTILEEIYNTQTYAMAQQQVIFFDEEEPDASEGDVWVGGV